MYLVVAVSTYLYVVPVTLFSKVGSVFRPVCSMNIMFAHASARGDALLKMACGTTESEHPKKVHDRASERVQ